MDNVDFFPLGDSGVVVKLGETIDLAIHEKVRTFSEYLDQHPFTGMVEYVPGFTTVTVYYNPVCLYDPDSGEMPYEHVVSILKRIMGKLAASQSTKPRLVEIPVCYGGEFGPDLPDVAHHNRLTPDEVILLHSAKTYRVYMIGFAPGFPYLGGMDERIATPRRESPRLSIPQGSVGIGGKQTGIYPIESPGGWKIIGRTPKRLFRPDSDPPSLLGAGDLVRFTPITRDAYEERKKGKP